MVRQVCLAAILLAASANVRGDDSCSTEVATRLCPKSRGDLLLLSCLRSHETEIARACKGDADALLATEREIAAECEGDASRLCIGVTPGGRSASSPVSGTTKASFRRAANLLSTIGGSGVLGASRAPAL